ncbi:MAG: serine hydrolase [Balneolaceae bacterium]
MPISFTFKHNFMVTIRTLPFIFALLFLWHTEAVSQDAIPRGFDTFVEQGLDEWNIPGIAIGIVKDGEILFTGGFGVRKQSEPHPVDEQTQFGIASVSKNMTAVAIGMLVDQGILDWDDRVIDHLPWFRLSDTYATEQATIRDLLTHQVGVGRMLGNRLQFMTNHPTQELLHHMRHHEFEQPFRQQYVYSNMMYAAAGEIVAAASGLEFGEYIERRLFEPLGMSRTVPSITRLDESNAAWPHQEIEGEVVEIPRRNWDNATPAGGVNSTVADMAKWMNFYLGTTGEWNGKRLVRPETMREIQTPKVSLPTNSITGAQVSYGYGLRITDYRGRRLLSHGGATDGMNTIFMLMPEEELGIIVITNTFSSFQQAVAYTLIDHFIGEEATDWNQIFKSQYDQRYRNAMEQRQAFESTRVMGTSASRPLDDYAGFYDDDLYGTMRISLNGETLRLTAWNDETLTATLEHWHYDTFRIVWDNPALREEFVRFHHALEGHIDSMTIRYTLRPLMLQVGAYPTNYYRDVRFQKIAR